MFGLRGVQGRLLNENDIIAINSAEDESTLFAGVGFHFGIFPTWEEALAAMKGKNEFIKRCWALK